MSRDRHTEEDKRRYFQALIDDAWGKYALAEASEIADEDRGFVKTIFQKGYAAAIADRMNAKWVEAEEED